MKTDIRYHLSLAQLVEQQTVEVSVGFHVGNLWVAGSIPAAEILFLAEFPLFSGITGIFGIFFIRFAVFLLLDNLNSGSREKLLLNSVALVLIK